MWRIKPAAMAGMKEKRKVGVSATQSVTSGGVSSKIMAAAAKLTL